MQGAGILYRFKKEERSVLNTVFLSMNSGDIIDDFSDFNSQFGF